MNLGYQECKKTGLKLSIKGTSFVSSNVFKLYHSNNEKLRNSSPCDRVLCTSYGKFQLTKITIGK